ncbi:MAG: hypothetical protein K2Q18_03145 [Bdellovibrionales bacterium]|nr:hypothetical protein [Bdellovibrionales bacterium]
MKKMIILIGLSFSLQTVFAGEVVKMPMQDFTPTDGMDYIFNIKTTKFEKVVLDCQSFITGMSFSSGGVEKSNIYLDMFMCEEMVSYLSESQRENLPVCIGLDSENQELYITREEGKDCE